MFIIVMTCKKGKRQVMM